MLIDLFKYLAILSLGLIIGYRNILSSDIQKKLSIIQNFVLLILVFIMGVSIGANKGILNNIFGLGFKSFTISAFSIFFSIIAIKIISSKFKLGGKIHEPYNSSIN